MDAGILKTNVKYDEIIDMSFVESEDVIACIDNRHSSHLRRRK